MKRLFRFFMVFLLIGMFMAGAAFIALAMYYRDNFPVNTWINGVYCTGRTVQEVNANLRDFTLRMVFLATAFTCAGESPRAAAPAIL